ncbi:MAG: hypothetical protein DCF15_07855 [Phormidesmis priestleyi]|uniref:Carrier domain-containing protein n=1 Tax=Phormidesmis priestleyi TaxID=268141 RepID=A0A2W4ZQ47_9CYAN|nr:MAG: hypothetical protein DCF15_07855 [Phormidesmis priestleyi]
MLVATDNVQALDVQTKIIALIQALAQDYDLDEPIEPTTALVADLGFASLDFVQLVVDIEAAFNRKLGFQALLVEAGSYIEDIQVGALTTFVQQQLHSDPAQQVAPGDLFKKAEKSTKAEKPKEAERSERSEKAVNADVVTRFRQTIRARQIVADDSGKNAQAIFVLCPPRSGSTLLRVMLAGHPQLFSPPELYLLMYNDLAQRRTELAREANSHLLEGTIRSIVELKGVSVETAEQMMADYEQQQMSTKQFYRLLQEWMGDRRLVDKTPLYPLDPGILSRAETDFVDPLYIHLVRHPYGTIRSYEESKLDRFVPAMYENPFERRQLAELTWLVSHQNITNFLQKVPQQRWLQLSFEDLVSQPGTAIGNLCDFLGLAVDPVMLEPYTHSQQRMLSGSRDLTRMPGDLKFHLHKSIDAAAACRWQQFFTDDFLADMTWQMAESLGYSAAEVHQLAGF